MRIKICGITNPEDALLSVNLGADALGFIFYEGSPRYVSVDLAKEVIDQLPPFVSKVGVFVNASAEKINTISGELNLTYAQLHGDESPDFVRKINYPTIKAFRVGGDFNFNQINVYDAKHFLFDTFSESAYGGTGEKFDWKTVPAEVMNKCILAGGISSENIDNIVRDLRPAAVDVSSKLESSPGRKDHDKMREFFKIYKRTIDQW